MIFCDLVVLCNKVPVAVVLAELISLLLLVVDVEIIVLIGTVEVLELTVSVKVIIARFKLSTLYNRGVEITAVVSGGKTVGIQWISGEEAVKVAGLQNNTYILEETGADEDGFVKIGNDY